MQLTIHYYASLREKLQLKTESVDCPDSLNTLADLHQWMSSRPSPFAEAFAQGQMIRYALNQKVVNADQSIGHGDEVAFFPPVTGGE